MNKKGKSLLPREEQLEAVERRRADAFGLVVFKLSPNLTLYDFHLSHFHSLKVEANQNQSDRAGTIL